MKTLEPVTRPVLGPDDLKGFETSVSYSGKVLCPPEDGVYKAFEKTNELFNQKVEKIMRAIMAVINQKPNKLLDKKVASPEFAEFTKWAITSIKAGECTTHVANPFTLAESRANPTHAAYKKDDNAAKMKECFYKCKENGERWYSRDKLFEDCPELLKGSSGLIAEMNQTAIEKIKGYFELKKLWREGDGKLLLEYKEEDFVKTVNKLLSNEDVTPDAFPPLEPFMAIKGKKEKKQRDDRLKELYRNRKLTPNVLDSLEAANQQFNMEKMGKDQWLAEKKRYQEAYPEFEAKYFKPLQDLVTKESADKKTKDSETPESAEPVKTQTEDNPSSKKKVNKPRDMRRWERDPNFIRVFDQWARTKWPENADNSFKSPFDDADAQTEWQALRKKHPSLPEEFNDQCVGENNGKLGRKLYVDYLKKLNPFLFESPKPETYRNGNGFFKLKRKHESFEKFKRPPGLTFPDPKNHPEPINFSGGGCFQYRNPKFLEGKDAGKVKMTVKLLDTNSETPKLKDYDIIVAMDSRLKKLTGPHDYDAVQGYWKKQPDGTLDFIHKLTEDGEVITKKTEYLHLEDEKGNVQRVQMKGGNLLFNAHKKGFYFQFRFTQLAPGIPKLDSLIPGDQILCVDAGQKADMVMVMLQADEDLALHPIAFEPFLFKGNKAKNKFGDKPKPTKAQFIELPGGTSFRAITHAEKKRNAVRKETSKINQKRFSKMKTPPEKTSGGYASKGQKVGVRLGRYIENCRKLRYKQLAGIMVKTALKNQARFIVVEDLKSYKTTLKQEKQENQRLNIWSMGKTHDFLEQLCKAKGLHLLKRSAAYTSQSCNRCGHFGVRYNELSKKQFKYAYTKDHGKEPPKDAYQPGRFFEIRRGGDWFMCSNAQCPGIDREKGKKFYRVQADMNAALNVGYKAWKQRAELPFESGYWDKPEYSGEKNKAGYKAVEDRLEKLLEAHYSKEKAKP